MDANGNLVYKYLDSISYSKTSDAMVQLELLQSQQEHKYMSLTVMIKMQFQFTECILVVIVGE